MKYFPLIWAGMWRKPLRTILTMLALATAFVLFGLLQGVSSGFDLLIASSHMDRMFVGPRFPPAVMPYAYKAQIERMPGVKEAIPVAFLGGLINGDLKRQMYVGAADGRTFDYFSDFKVTPAELVELNDTRTGIIISALAAHQWGLKAGDRVMMKSPVAKKDGSSWQFDVVAVVDRPDLPMFVGLSAGNFQYINEERAAGKDMVNQFYIVMSDPSVSVATARAIDNMFLSSGVPTHTLVEKAMRQEQMAGNTVTVMAKMIVLSSLFALLLLTSNSLMQAFRERIPELGTLKAIGFTDRQVLGVVVGEAVVQCLVGAAVGLAIARAIIPYLKRAYYSPVTALISEPASLVALGLLVAILVALISAAVPAWRAGRMQIIDALAVR